MRFGERLKMISILILGVILEGLDDFAAGCIGR
jgi:hypothetical protein